MSSTGATVKKGREHYSHDKADARVDKRRQEADAREREYDGLTIPAKIARAKSRRGESKRELAKLEKALALEKAPAVKQAPLTEAEKSAKAVKRAQNSVK